ncbi:receptor kinase-like protein Xa21 [Oryza brachyantha]|nr:receptor kinase-like protein Xa21 [Oryza brachyantha]
MYASTEVITTQSPSMPVNMMPKSPAGGHSCYCSLSFSLVPTIFVLTYFTFFANATSSGDASNSDFQALLCLKQHFANTSAALGSWRSTGSLDHCTWPGVTCSRSHASRVTGLDLEMAGLDGQLPPCIANLTLLTRIHLPFNQLTGEIPAELGDLRHLSYLNLSSNHLSGKIPNSLSSCRRLQIIDLGINSLSGEIPAGLNNCMDLQVIYLDHNKLYGSIPEGLGMLPNLSELTLASNNLTGSIPFSLGSSPSLSLLSLPDNRLTGGIPPLLANSSSLRFLALTNNDLTGQIPPALFNSTQLEVMGLAGNQFFGSIPSIPNIYSPLKYLVLSQNNLSGIIPCTIGNFSDLVWLLLAENNFHGDIPLSIGTIPYLDSLDLTINNLSRTVPPSIYNMSELTYLGMGTNRLVGEIPEGIGQTLPSIQTLIMQGNRFQGSIPSSLANATNLQVINLRDNALHGIVPSFGLLPDLSILMLGQNQLEAGDWSFISSLTNCTKLREIYLDNNNLEGMLPSSITSLSKSLEILYLTANKISGTIPPGIGYLTNLTLLQIESNLLTGNIPETLGNLSNLLVLSLSHNKLSGKIPLSIGELSKLTEMYLQENDLSGSIPRSLGECKNLVTLNLSCNTLEGNIPKEIFYLYSLSECLDLSHNHLSGHIPLEIGGLVNLGPLNISNNQLSGEIPSTLANCLHLESLHMEGNLLDGRIPESFMNLRGIIDMDLSRNNLSGEIPKFFKSFSSLKILNLSFNNLEGPVPTGGIFYNASEVFVQGNKKLCSNFHLLQLPNCYTLGSKRKHNLHIVMAVGLATLALFFLSCLLAVVSRKTKRAKKQALLSTKELKRVSYSDLLKATNGFSSANLIGSGKYGSVYKGRFDSEGHEVAIKVFKLDQLGAPKSFIAECEALRNTRHRNLVKVITACSTSDTTGNEFKALVLDYMANGSLESCLYPKLNKYVLEKPLSLGSRITIAVDVACALDYLHNHCNPPIVHCDLKPSNVLLDDVMGACVGDFGLAKLLHIYPTVNNSSTSLFGPRGSVGYIAPEYGIGRKISTKGDIYSYGIMVLEMLTGKCPTDEMFKDGLSIHKFVEKSFPQNIGDIIDPNIIPNFEDDDLESNLDRGNHAIPGFWGCIMKLLKLGLSCSLESPKDRPTAQDVYFEVTTVKTACSALSD